jgi:hypothetical protein
MNSAYAPNSQPRIPTRVCQGHVVTTNLPTLGTNPNSKQHGSATQEAKDLGNLQSLGRNVRMEEADYPRGSGGPSTSSGRTVRKCHPNLQCYSSKKELSVPYSRTVRTKDTVCTLLTDHLANSEQTKAPDETDRNKATQEFAKNTTNYCLEASWQTVRQACADHLRVLT